MARGQKQKADTQLGMTNAIGAEQQQRANASQDQLVPEYTSLRSNPVTDAQRKARTGYTSLMGEGYLSPEDEAAATTSEMGAATQPFESMGFEAANRAARTGNASDLTAQQDQLALDKGRTSGEAASNLQREKMSNQLYGMQALDASGQQEMQNKLAAMYGLGDLGKGSREEAMGMYGLGPSTLQGRAAGGGWAQGFSSVLGALPLKDR